MKNKKILIVIAIALVCLIAATVCLIAFLSPMRTTFYVFKGDYKAGTTITKDMLTPVQADSRLVVAGTDAKATTYFITNENLGDLVKSGDALRTDVKKGEAFLITHVSGKGGTDIEIKMSPNAVAVTIPVSSITGITDKLKAESHVNVYATYSSGETQLLLESIRVLSVTTNNGQLEGVTLELTKAQAPVAINAINIGSLYLGLINSDGYIFDAA